MASSSFSAATPPLKYDVFLSFNGEDTGYYFTSHLYEALCRQNIHTFINDEFIRGDQISPSLLRTITEESKLSVIVFSQRYASSVWCLQELVKILECRYGQIVIPVFYHLDPSAVRNQTGTFGNGFAELEERYKDMPKILQKWRDALRVAADLPGFIFNSAEISAEPELIEIIVPYILERLNIKFPPFFKDNIYEGDVRTYGLVGIYSKRNEIEKLLCIGEPGIRKIGICGFGGIGKTTLARLVFNKHSHSFESSCFIENIREESGKSLGLSRLRQELNSTILGDRLSNKGSNLTTKRCGLKNALIVFDDVTSLEQIEYIIEDLDNLGLTSRFIITTRDKKLLKKFAVDHLYVVEELNYDDGLKLFCHHAFGIKDLMVDYLKLSSRIVRYCGGVPLIIKALGSFLFGMGVEEWARTIHKLEIVPGIDIYKALKICYDGLNEEEKCIYLDIACFFKGCDRDLVKEILDACGFHTEIGINVLIEKSLISVSSNTITMHDILQEMGWEIVRRESINDDPGKYSRLWHHQDIYHVLTKFTGSEAIRSICLDMSKMRDINLDPNAFAKMHNLRFLKVYGSHDDNKVHGFEAVKCNFRELRCLYWYKYPAKSLSAGFHFHKLVALDMPYSNIEKLCIGLQILVNLKHINLSYSKHLLKISNLSLAPNLESLILEGCTNVHVHEILPVIHNLKKLAICNISNIAA